MNENPRGGCVRWLAVAAVVLVVALIAAGLLQPTARVEGRVMLEGQPVANAEVVVTIAHGARESVTVLPWLKPQNYAARTDAEGRYALSRVRTDCALWIGVIPRGERGPAGWIELEVADGETTTLNLEMPRRDP